MLPIVNMLKQSKQSNIARKFECGDQKCFFIIFIFHYLNITAQQIYFICISLSDGLERQSVRGKGIRRKYVETGWLDKVCMSDWAGVWGENDSGHNPHCKSVRAARKSFVLQKLAMHSVCGPPPSLGPIPLFLSSLPHPSFKPI